MVRWRGSEKALPQLPVQSNDLDAYRPYSDVSPSLRMSSVSKSRSKKLSFLEFSICFFLFAGLALLSFLFYKYRGNTETTFSIVEQKRGDFVEFSGQKFALSIILPTYNGFPLLEDAVRSIVNLETNCPSSSVKFELVVVDDGSFAPSSISYLNDLHTKSDHIRVLRLSKNVGLPSALNVGINAARGNWLSWTSDDNILLPNFICAFSSLAKEYPESGMLIAAHDVQNMMKNDERSSRRRYKGESFYGSFWPAIKWDGLAAFAWRKSVGDQVGLFDSSLVGAEDWNYWIRICEHVAVNPATTDVVYLYRQHKDSMSSRISAKVWNASLDNLGNQLWFLDEDADVILDVAHMGKIITKIFPSVRHWPFPREAYAEAWAFLGHILLTNRGWVHRRFPDSIFSAFVCFRCSYRILESIEEFQSSDLMPAVLRDFLVLAGKLEEYDIIDFVVSQSVAKYSDHPGVTQVIEEIQQLASNAHMTTFSGSKLSSKGVLQKGLFLKRHSKIVDMYRGRRISEIDAERPYRILVLPSDPLKAYVAKGREHTLEGYYNPLKFFDETYVVSPLEKEPYEKWGMTVIPAKNEDDIAKFISSHDIDVVRAYGGYRACDWAIANRVDGVPIICSVHDPNPKLIHESVKQADFVFTMSEIVTRHVIQAGSDPSRIFSFGNGVDFKIFHPYSAAFSAEERKAYWEARYPGKYHILHVGRKTEQKNFDNVIKALKYLGPDYVAIFVGRGSEKILRDLAVEEGVSDQIYMEQMISNDDLPEMYSFADAVCNPSRWEGFGVVFVEALASGAALVTSNRAPMSKFVTHKENGYLVDDIEDPEAIADALRSVITNSALSTKLRKNAPPSVLSYSQTHMSRWEVEMYRFVLHEKGNIDDERA